MYTLFFDKNDILAIQKCLELDELMHDQIKHLIENLYKFFKFNNRLLDIINYDEELLDIFSKKVLDQIKKGENGWEKMLPKEVTKQIKSKKLFGFK